MEHEQHHYELRSGSRSRSHTPMVPSRPLPDVEVTEHHYDLRSRSRERSHTPGEVTSSRRSGSRSLTGSSTKMHEKNMETIEENKEEGSVVESVTDNQSTKSESSIPRKAERRSERQRAKRQIFANGQSENKEDTSDQKVERKHKSVTSHRILTSDYSSEEGEREDPPSRPGSAYEIYKQAGEWWNVFPKTDYTYSRASQCRYEIAPGVLAMPNMSRRSIHTDDSGNNFAPQSSSQASRRTTESGFSDTVDTVDLKETGPLLRSSEDILRTSDSVRRSAIYKKTHVEQYMSHKEVVYTDSGSSGLQQRYTSWFSTPSRYTDVHNVSQYDSDAEFDKIMTSSVVKANQRWKIVQWFTYFVTFVVVWFMKTTEFFKFRTDRRSQYYDAQTYRYFHESRWSTLRKTVEHYSRNIYFFIARLFLFDTWLLSQFTGVRKWLQEKTPRIIWIALIPLLLLLGCWWLAEYLSLFPVGNVPEMEKVSAGMVQWKNRKSREIKGKLGDALIGRIATLEEEQIHQMEHLMNITRILEDYKRSDADFQKKYNDIIADVANKQDVSELSGILSNELKVIKHEFEKLRDLYTELKFCCDANKEAFVSEDIEKHVEKILSGYFPLGTSKEDLTRGIQKMLASRDDQAVLSDNVGAYISEERVRKVVKEILRIYDADKTGQVDYALESAGGQIISTRCTQRYDIKSKAFSLFGFTLYYESNNPRTVIQGNALQPGGCWAFQDFPGYLLIQLRCVIHVTGFTLEHVSSLILPNENMSSAPKKFDVWGLTDENDPEPVRFGEYEFILSEDSLQYFPVQNTEIKRPYEYIELRIHSNHGQLDYTCLYRFRVHGRSA
ncbi:PREDICTED: uncharacterized protein LOC106743199 [Dinoponera quadriceps]|uniref:Uncharacterized protein LOC106743199 n=1 Tax=Dinoponera quadriceps TaxID=609295 RepID=A0A6P3X1Q2_DINQU|nr:PREDICTED: uncharacterized protein LOC106743199 [Dinoponera quadriceps]XP_014472298.1 PREDICTED: uncharacterized protein LOC106743199 [Dinoponera quadriceps]XP_014472299.1 PREDICTED: uncharacterized protein LOC106743199 [Dinoponera quadriceps]XP_014472301.1 PREDICTED: uncharacterized protein LOC106743199 [Dinoponera quadriceps]XP_014472302.1 PREDICTED: uncharacterized protein LOC106743199 [Dinoponera quadriceps]